jgi:hypothetical protein
LNKLVEITSDIKHKDEVVSFKDPLDINKLLPGFAFTVKHYCLKLMHFPFFAETGAYYTYLGSL